ncbi:ECM14 protein [Sodiomyces alkalinus F11]|uniref:ECM14 protein n=1 Tax=Sodiomyces alkalinus (strain CBS 110278 / VKM F-3762 / F11) TaxID=1314773 RepID=A0A3N2Q6H0_SODAK|nr:ECM14 protein [Sodiomyces alkalinus F11]ROT42379.1 ECM14 protein [Sodiomyces alkalinus F11]
MKLLGTLAFSALAAAAAVTGPQPRNAVAGDNNSKVSYEGYHVYRIRAGSPREIEEIEHQLSPYHSAHGRDTLEVVIPPHEVRSFEAMGFDAQLLSRDLSQQIRAESAVQARYSRSLRKRDDDLPDLSWFDSYHAYEDHLDYWDDLAAAFPGHAEKVYLGDSYEGREIYAFNFWGDEEGKESKPVILWHSTVHAREWISTMVLEYLTYQLIDGYKSGDANVTRILDHYDFWMVPFHNPDGFVYSQTTDRMWRKNRQPRSNTTCVGTDNNRNWKYQWNADPEGGSVSPDPCSQSYKGQCAGDTPENVAVSALSSELAAREAGIRSYIDWHSYSQLILTPYGWSCKPEDLPATLPRMMAVGEGVAAAIAAESGKRYVVGPACEVLYASSGTGRDHHHGALAADHSWTLELRPANAREGGFILPPEQIWSTVREQWAGQLWMLNEVWDN